MTDSKAFGKLLKTYLSKLGIAEEDFAKTIGTSQSKVAEWESGAKMPNRSYTERIVKALQLKDDQALELLSLIGHDSFEEHNLSTTYRPTGIVITDVVADRSTKLREREIQIFKSQLKQTQQTVDEINSKLNAKKTTQGDEQLKILLDRIKDTLSQMRVPTQPITANVILPPPEDMEVRLISSTSLQRLEEYRSEENRWFALMGIFLGALIGIIINIVTGGEMSKNAWVLFFVFAGFALFTGCTARRYKIRGNNILSRILRERPSIESQADLANSQ